MFRYDSQFDCETIKLLTAQKTTPQLKNRYGLDIWHDIIEGDKVKEEYFDKYDGIHAQISQAQYLMMKAQT